MLSALDSAKIFQSNGARIFICNLTNQDHEFHKEKFPSTE